LYVKKRMNIQKPILRKKNTENEKCSLGKKLVVVEVQTNQLKASNNFVDLSLTCKCDLTWAKVRSFTSISSRTDLGVAPTEAKKKKTLDISNRAS
jgi:hypothetical protein